MTEDEDDGMFKLPRWWWWRRSMWPDGGNWAIKLQCNSGSPGETHSIPVVSSQLSINYTHRLWNCLQQQQQPHTRSRAERSGPSWWRLFSMAANPKLGPDIIPSVERGSPVLHAWRHIFLLLLLLLLSYYAQKNLGMNNTCRLLTNAPETLRQSSPQLFHFADFLRGLGGWHQVAHFSLSACLSISLYLSLSLSLCVHTPSFAADRRCGLEAGKEDRSFSLPCGASPAQLQSLLENRKRSLSLSLSLALSLFLSLSLTQLVTTNAFLGFFFSSRAQLHLQKRQ